MNFDATHYLAVMKLKQGEKIGLSKVDSVLRPGLTPLFEIVKRKATPLDAHLKKSFKKLDLATQGYKRVFVDAGELEPDGEAGARRAFEEAKNTGLLFTPVTRMSRDAETNAALGAKAAMGLAIRIDRSDLEGDLSTSLPQFLKDRQLRPGECDLIVDLGPVSDMVIEGVNRLALGLLAEVRSPEQWRTLSIIGGAFPKGLGDVDRDGHATIERLEWIFWRDTLRQAGLPRLPTFGDWGIQHPKGVEDFEPGKMQVSAALRYAVGDHWLALKGRSLKGNPASVQMPKLTKKLVSGALRQNFSGADHCAGCRKVAEIAAGSPNPGSATTWRELGTTHHITTTVEALRTLHAP